jgi:hypothetical protein
MAQHHESSCAGAPHIWYPRCRPALLWPVLHEMEVCARCGLGRHTVRWGGTSRVRFASPEDQLCRVHYRVDLHTREDFARSLAAVGACPGNPYAYGSESTPTEASLYFEVSDFQAPAFEVSLRGLACVRDYAPVSREW